MNRKQVGLFVFLLLFCVCLQKLLFGEALLQKLPSRVCSSEAFRKMELDADTVKELKQLCTQKNYRFSTMLAAFAVQNDFSGQRKISEKALLYTAKLCKKEKGAELLELEQGLSAVWQDLVCFPVGSRAVPEECFFENSWGNPRQFQSKRRHEGCDVFAATAKRGVYPVISMTDGWVERIGWLPLGGYRIGIRSPHGGYFYYAHLDAYAKDFRVGEKIRAGELLGTMGDSGYGSEGTRGKFPVHLHLGIYIRTPYCRKSV